MRNIWLTCLFSVPLTLMFVRGQASAQAGYGSQQQTQPACEHNATHSQVTQSSATLASFPPGEDYPGFVWGNTPPQLQATEKQAKEYCSLMEAADGARLIARELREVVKGSTFALEGARKLETRLRREIDLMASREEDFAGRLSEAQRAATKDSVHKTDGVRQIVKSELQLVDQELNQLKPDGRTIAGHAKRLESSIKRLEGQYQVIASEIGIGN